MMMIKVRLFSSFSSSATRHISTPINYAQNGNIAGNLMYAIVSMKCGWKKSLKNERKNKQAGEKNKQREKVMDKAISSFTRPRTQFPRERSSFREKFARIVFSWKIIFSESFFLLSELFLNNIATNSNWVDKNITENSENFTVWRLRPISSQFPSSRFMALPRPFNKNRNAFAILPLSRDGRAFTALPGERFQRRRT